MAGLTAAGVLGASLIVVSPAAARQPLTERSVKVTVLSVSPSTPARSAPSQPLTVTLQLVNTTDQSFKKLTVRGERGNPIDSQQALDAALAKPRPPDSELSGSFPPRQPVTFALGPRASTRVTYSSTTSTSAQAKGLCLCQNRIYPLYFSIRAAAAAGGEAVVGSAQTYIPAFGNSAPRPVRVSWVWPIIDRPHRLTDDTAAGQKPVFTDDNLASSIAGGRLDRVLSVVETAGKVVPLALVVDPELIDELAVMSAGPYEYPSKGKLVAGTGTSAAASWLGRLRAALNANRAIAVNFTPPSDPDIESLTRNGLAWTTGLGRQAQARVTSALGGHPVSTEVSWPAGGSLSSDSLDAVVRQGARTVVLSETALSGGAKRATGTDALASLQTPAGRVLAAVTSSRIQRYVGPTLSVGGPGYAELPKLVAEVAIRAVADGLHPHFVVIVAPRDIDPSEVATPAIRATTQAFWAAPFTLSAARPPNVTPTDHGQLVPPARGALALPPLTIVAAQNLTRAIPALSTMLNPDDADALLGPLPAALQRAESTAWRTAAPAGVAFAGKLSERINAIESGVRILKPSSGTYTLASTSSPLPLTVENTLNVAVFIRIRVTSANRLPGFTAGDVGRQSIAPHAKLTLHIPTHVELTGRFKVQAALYTPSNVRLGEPVFLSVHSTALGAIGVIITIASAAVLLLALLIRFGRRLRNPKPAPGTAAPLIEA